MSKDNGQTVWVPQADDSPGHSPGRTDSVYDYILKNFRDTDNTKDFCQEVFTRLLETDLTAQDRDPFAIIDDIARQVLEENPEEYTQTQDPAHANKAASSRKAAQPMAATGADRIEDQVWAGQKLTQILQALSPLHAAILLRFRRDGFTRKEIAKELHLTPNTVKKYLTRIHTLIRKHLADE